MKIFDFTVNTQNATIDDFNNSVDYLRYMDARSNWNTDSYSINERPAFFNKEPLTYEEYENWIKAVYVFIERCNDFYPPSNNFNFPYRKFNIKNGIEHYLRIYIMMEYLKNREYSMFAYNYYNDETTPMEKELSTFVNTSQFIRAFIIAYHPVVDFDMDDFKDFGRSFKMMDIYLDSFPFTLTRFGYTTGINELGEEISDEISFAIPEYVICEEKLYKVKPSECYINHEKIQSYFQTHPEHKKDFDVLINEIKNNQTTKKELESKLSNLWDERAHLLKEKKSVELEHQKVSNRIKFSYNNIFYQVFTYNKDVKICSSYFNQLFDLDKKIEAIQKDFDSIENEIRELSGKNKMRTFILSLPDFIPYKEV